MKKSPQQFALEQIAPYLLGEQEFGYDPILERCTYYAKTPKGVVMCIAGKNLLEPENVANSSISNLYQVAKERDMPLFKPESDNILSIQEWQDLQRLHDSAAKNRNFELVFKKNTEWEITLFTIEELLAYCLLRLLAKN